MKFDAEVKAQKQVGNRRWVREMGEKGAAGQEEWVGEGTEHKGQVRKGAEQKGWMRLNTEQERWIGYVPSPLESLVFSLPVTDAVNEVNELLYKRVLNCQIQLI